MFNLKYFVKNLIINPSEIFEETIEDLKKDLKYKNHKNPHKKIWICGLPKSGTTLIEQILDNLPYIRVDRSTYRSFSNKDNLDTQNFTQYFSYFPDNKFTYVKTHLHFEENLVENLKKNNFSIIVTLRDIRDTMISRYYHILNDNKHWQHEIIKNENFEQGFINSLTKDKSKYRNDTNYPEPLVNYYYWIKNWKSFEDENIKKIWFEDFKENPLKFIKGILKFTSFDNFDSENIFKKIKIKNQKDKKIKLSIKLNRRNKNVSTFRSGKVGEWKKLFTKKIDYEFNKIIPEDLSKILK